MAMRDISGMKILVASHGSRGDTQPFLALGPKLEELGAKVVVFTNPESEPLVTGLGLRFLSNGFPFKEFFGSDEVTKAFTDNNFLGFLDALTKQNAKCGPTQYANFYKALEEEKPDLVLCGTQHWTDVVWIGILFRIPCLVMNLQNSHTVDVRKAPFNLPTLPCGMNRVIWNIAFGKYITGLKNGVGPTLEKLSGKPLGSFFQTLTDLHGIFGSNTPDDFPSVPYIIASDKNFVGTQPYDLPRFNYVGNLIVPAGSAKIEEFGGGSHTELDAFLATCPEPPVYIGWGSLKCISDKWMSLIAVRSLKLTGRKGIVLSGWSDMSGELLGGEADSAALIEFSKNNILFMKSAEHESLFPKCAVIVHHGGAGTTVAGVRSGKPNIVTPIFYDQFDLAEHVAKSGQGIATKALPKLKAEDLAAEIKRALTDATMIKKAEEVGTKLRAHDGIKVCSDIIVNFICDDVKTGKYWTGFDKFAATKKERDAQGCCSRPLCGQFPA